MFWSNDGGKTGGDSGGDEMVTQEDTIFVSGMNAETNEDEIANHFGAIGIIKVSSIHFFFYKQRLVARQI